MLIKLALQVRGTRQKSGDAILGERPNRPDISPFRLPLNAGANYLAGWRKIVAWEEEYSQEKVIAQQIRIFLLLFQGWYLSASILCRLEFVLPFAI